jgi:hypothetical protein
VSSTPAAHRRRREARAGRIILVVLASLTIIVQSAVLAGAGWAAANPRVVADQVTVRTTELDPAVAEYAVAAGLSARGLFLLHASRTEIVAAERFDGYCTNREPGIGVLGCYTLAEGRIFLYDVTNPDLAALEPVVAAHEMLHAAWDRMSSAEHRALAPLLEEAFASLGPEHELVERIAAYEAVDPRSRIPELYAIIGSEVPVIPRALEQHYRQWFDDRSQSTALSARVSALFRDLEVRLSTLSEELTELAARITAEQAAYDALASELQSDIEIFNSRAQTPGWYTNESTFLRDRDALLVRQDALDEQLAATNALVARYNALLDQLQQLNAEAETLNRAINITLDPLQTRESVDTPTEG